MEFVNNTRRGLKKNKIIIIVFVLVVAVGVLGFGESAMAQVISGISQSNINNGDSVTISGSGFGTKSTAAPMRFDTFDSGEIDSEIGSEGWWTAESNNNIHYSTLMQRSSQSTKNIIAKYLVPEGRNDAGGIFYRADAFGGLAGKKFISMWVYVQFKTLNAFDHWQLKIWRVSAGPQHTDYVSTSLQSWWNPDGSSWWNYYELAFSGSPNIDNIGLDEGQWIQLQWQFEDSSGIDVADAHLTVTTLRADGTRTKNVRNSWTSRTATYPNPLNVPKFGYYLSNNINPGHEVWTYWDDIYIDDSWARVEIGNASSYDSCTHREMQVPTSWDSQNIQFKFNQGSFTEGQTAYIFVIDESGIPNEIGFPITIGSSLPAPSISLVNGLVADGQQITITGTGFGASGPYILLFDDFSGALDGEQLPTSAVIGQWNFMPSIAFADPVLSKGQGARCVDANGWINANSILFRATFSEVFVTSITYVPAGYRFPYANNVRELPAISSLKHHWLCYTADGYKHADNKPDIFTPSWTGYEWYPVSSNDGDPRGSYDLSGDVKWVWDEPVRWTIWIKGNGTSISGSDGLFQAVSSTGQIYHRYKDYKAWFTPTDIAYGFDRMTVVGWLRDPCSYPMDNYVIDDVYVAVGPNAAARVEIGDAPIYEECTKLAISTPDTWSNTEIVATAREGTFKLEETAYLFVVDADGTPSDGYPITIGSGGDTTTPTRFSGQPNGTLSAGTTQTNISLSTNINATCQYSITPNTNYTDMTGSFTSTNSTNHSTQVTGLENGQIYTYYVRCNSTEGYVNDDDFNISFSIDGHKADLNDDGVIDMMELMAFIRRWKLNDGVNKQEVEEARDTWFTGGVY